jgi:hypothetical protein
MRLYHYLYLIKLYISDDLSVVLCDWTTRDVSAISAAHSGFSYLDMSNIIFYINLRTSLLMTVLYININAD